MRPYSFFYILTSFFLIAQNCKGQKSDSYNEFVQSTKLLCTSILTPFNLNCSYFDKRIDEKLNSANIYLVVQLSQLYIADSSTFYQDKIKELERLENQKPSNARDSLILLNEKEKLYLLTSVLSPGKSYSNFINLIQCYYELSKTITIPKNSLAFYAFKNYLYELLINRFPNEPHFSRNRNYNSVTYFTNTDFVSYNKEKINLAEIEKLMKVALKEYFIDKEYNLIYVYNTRALRLREKFDSIPSNELSKSIELIYSMALSLNPDDYTTNYNYGTYYYNQAVRMTNSLPHDISDKELEIEIDKIKELFIKAQPYLDKTVLKNKR